MDLDIELEDILYTVKNEKKNPDEPPTESEPLAPPRSSVKNAEPSPEPGEKPAETPKAEEAEPAEELVWIEPKKDGKDKKPKKSFKDISKKLFSKKVAIVLIAIIGAAALCFGGVKVYQFAKVAYLKPYEKQYGIEYPIGIAKEFCDDYGKDQSLSGRLTIPDTQSESLVYSTEKDGVPLLEKGSSVSEEQQFRSIALSSDFSDLESVYSTPDGFLKASQEVTFKTLFEEDRYRVIAAFYTNTDPADDKGYVFPYYCYGNMTEKSFKQYIDKIQSRRLYDTGYELTPEDSILTLSVDSDTVENFRFVIVCVKAEGFFKKSETAEPNERIHYPQKWYDLNSQENPYYLAGKWFPEIYTDAERTQKQKLTAEDFNRE